MKSSRKRLEPSCKSKKGNSQKKCIPYNPQTLSTSFKPNVGHCCIERTQPIKQKKQNWIKMFTPAEVQTS